MAVALREQRRIETIKLIQQAALRLAARQDADTVTVEAICAEAGVSVRTFFNYFPVREAAFVVGPPPFPDAAIATFLNGDGPFFEALIALLQTRLPVSGQERKALCMAMSMASREPRMAAMQISAIHTHEAELGELISKRLRSGPDDMTPKLVSAAALATTRVVISQWAAGDGTENVRDMLERGLVDVRRLIGS